jgi:hypothetical protein
MTQQHVLYGIKVAERVRERERERERERDGLWCPVSRLLLPASAGTHLTRRPFKITDRCANDLRGAQLLASSGGIKAILFIKLVKKILK